MDRVFVLHMPEADSSDDSLRLSNMVADALGLRGAVEVITPILEGAGCYRRRDEAVRRGIHEFGPHCKRKLVLPHISENPSHTIPPPMAHGRCGKTCVRGWRSRGW